MATTISVQEQLAQPPRRVMELLADPDVARRRTQAVRDFKGEVVELVSSPGPDGPESLRMTSTAMMPVQWLGGLAGSPRLIRTELWHRNGAGYLGAIRLTVESMPVACTGSSQLDPRGTGSWLSMELGIGVDVPVMGPMIESKVSGLIRDVMAVELRLLKHLASHA